MNSFQGEQSRGLPPYKHIETNEFSYRKHKKQKEEDIAICVCLYDANDQDSACGEQCLNVLTSTECTPGYCPCGSYCKNQRFQKCEYAKLRLFKTEGRGWGLLADENVKAGQFVIEYCGEVISCKEAKRRSHAYEAEGLKDAFIISLNAQESIDATKKGSLARFINHSCQPNCETRKWNVLGEVRVGIFAKQDIAAGTELAYDYNFEWFGGAKVRCLCGAPCCSGFLGAKSRGFQEAAYLWEDDDDRFSVENIPLYDSDDDDDEDLTSHFLNGIAPSNNSMAGRDVTDSMRSSNGHETPEICDSKPISAEPISSVAMEVDGGKFESGGANCFSPQDGQNKLTLKSSMISRIRSNSACRNYQIQSNSISKSPHYSVKSKRCAKKQVNVKLIGERLSSIEASDELLAFEVAKNEASLQLNSLYDEIRPAIEKHERDTQDCVPTSIADRWIAVSCNYLKADFDLSASIIENISKHVLFKNEGADNGGVECSENGN